MKPAIVGIVLAAVVLPGVGCAVDEEDGAPTGETQQAVSSLGFWSWGCTSTCGLPLGTAKDTEQTCFLAGVWGNLQPAAGASEVFVQQTGGHWELQIITSGGRPLGGTAVCVPGGPSKVAQWQSGGAEVSLGTAPGRRCFLSGVRNTSGFTAATDFVQVRALRSGWFLGGNMTSAKDALATAVCVDGPSDGADYGLVAGDGGAFYNVPIQSNNPGGWACGIKKLGGHFTTSDYGDGVWIDYNNGISEWELNAVNGKQVTTDCLN